MNRTEAVERVVAPWLADLDSLERWVTAASANGNAVEMRCSLQRLRTALGLLCSLNEAIRAETQGDREVVRAIAVRQNSQDWQLPWGPAQNKAKQPGFETRDTRPDGFNETRMTRESVLKLSVWRTLKQWMAASAAKPQGSADPLRDLLLGIAQNLGDVPPGIAPSLDFANTESAMALFNNKVCGTLRRLAQKHPRASDALLALAEMPPYDATGLAVHRWSRAWTVAVAGTYHDWLYWHSGGDLDLAMANVWGSSSARMFKPLPGLRALLSRDRDIHLDLWTGLVHAQALSHEAKRFERDLELEPWHCVRLKMHDISQRDKRVKGGKGYRTLFSGLGIEMIYQVVFVECVQRLLPPTAVANKDKTMKLGSFTPIPLQFHAQLPGLSVGQRMNLPVLMHWQQNLAGQFQRDPNFRLSAPQPELELTTGQQQVLGTWRRSFAKQSRLPQTIDPSTLGWRGPDDSSAYADELGDSYAVLGHCPVWAAAGDETEWLELALVVISKGRWFEVPLVVHDEWPASQRQTTLLMPSVANSMPAEVTAERVRAALGSRSNTCWVLHHAGLGAFVLAAADLDRDPP